MARYNLSIVPLLFVVLCRFPDAACTQGINAGRRLFENPPTPPSSPSSSPPPSTSPSPSSSSAPPSEGYDSSTGLDGITPAKVPGADYPADVITCAILQSATPSNSTSASEGVNRLLQRGGNDNNSKSPVAGTLAATMSCAILTKGPSGQAGAPGLAATVQAAVRRGDSAVRPFAVGFAYTFASGSPTLQGYLKSVLDAIVGPDGCTVIVRLLSSAYTAASASGQPSEFSDGISSTLASDGPITTCFKDYGSLSSSAAATSAFKAAGAASS